MLNLTDHRFEDTSLTGMRICLTRLLLQGSVFPKIENKRGENVNVHVYLQAKLGVWWWGCGKIGISFRLESVCARCEIPLPDANKQQILESCGPCSKGNRLQREIKGI